MLRSYFLIVLIVLFSVSCTSMPQSANDQNLKSSTTISAQQKSFNRGFFSYEWNEAEGKILLHVSDLDSPFIYQTSLARGIGSNDIGADRGMLGDTKLVEFFRSGSKLLLIEKNTTYRAYSDNEDERQAIEESFAQSVLWGFKVEREVNGALVVDATDFLLRDSLSLGQWLSGMEQGNYAVDTSRSAIYLPRTRAFKDNTEFEAILTLTGAPTGDIIGTVVPDANAVTVHTHHSFVRLPEPGYDALLYDPRAGYLDPKYGGGFADYAVPIDQSISKSFTRRHRLHKKNPELTISEPVEPIIYYLDRGAPEPVRTALLDGARWWNQAFEAAGYKNAFRIEMLPDDADPLDVRYNVIQWVHRSTRGWSYGASIVDPRTGEIIKGHVSLGSLRVRQDYMLAEGFLAPYTGGKKNPAMEALALARIRQLSAHEVGHTIGLEHNFAGSVNERASVMDYPFPLVTLNTDGSIDVSNAYAEGIGAWDKRAVLWGYQDFPEGVNATVARDEILKETWRMGLKYVADSDARNPGSAHVDGNLWDNGADPVAELARLMQVREAVLRNFSAANLQSGRPMATLEEVLVPMYLLHRFQIQAAGKVLGGGYYQYDLKGDGQAGFRHATAAAQRLALNQVLETLSPPALVIPENISQLISPRPPGSPRGRETFDRRTRQLFDDFAPADAAISLTLDVLLEPSRGERLNALETSGFGFGYSDILNGLLDRSIKSARQSGPQGEIQRRLNTKVVERLIALASSAKVTASVRASVLTALQSINGGLPRGSASDRQLWQAHDALMQRQLRIFLEGEQNPVPVNSSKPPPGSPIGH